MISNSGFFESFYTAENILFQKQREVFLQEGKDSTLHSLRPYESIVMLNKQVG